MPQPLSGPGLGLPLPQALYPTNLYNSPYTAPTNQFDIGPAGTQPVPAGNWFAVGGQYSVPQYLNPVTQQWTDIFPRALLTSNGWGMMLVSDGFNVRIANTTDTAYAATVSAAGSGYVQSSTTVTAGTGNSVWVPIVGGALGTFTVGTAGSGYTIPPRVFIPYPPAPGVPATAYATLSTGTVSAVTIDQAGAGYLTAPPVLLIPDPADPSTNIVNAAATVALTGAGTLTAVLLSNFGEPLTTAPTLTVNGVGSSATATTVPASVVASHHDIVTLQPASGPY